MQRSFRIALAVLLASLTWSLALAAEPSPATDQSEATESSARPLRVLFLDVGQGDAILFVSPEGRAVLVDGGPRRGGDVILEALRSEGVERLDLIVASHPHLDHIGGFEKVLRSFPVRYYMDPGYPHSSRAYESLLKTLEELRVPVLTGRVGRRVNMGGGVVLEVLAPAEPLHTGTRSDVNSNSIVARVTHGDFSVLLAGDAEEPTERFLVGSRGGIRATVLKVAHHGGRHSTTAGFLDQVSPEVAVVQVGRNSYGHPAPETLERLSAVGARVYRNDLHGTVTIESDGTDYVVRTERAPGSERSEATETTGGQPGSPRGPPARAN